MKFSLFLYGLLLSICSPAQNLVINGSFEDANVCTEIHQYCSPSAWFYIKNHPQGYGLNPIVQPSDGKAVLQLYTVNAVTNKRTYWQTMLLCPLVKGREYKISVDMTASATGPNLNDLGFYFVNDFLFSYTDTLLQPANYVPILDAKAKRLKNGWFRIQKKFVAEDNYQFLVIGNFSSQSNKEIAVQRKSLTSISYFIDDLNITPVGKSECSGNEKLVDSLYGLHDRHSHGDISADTVQPIHPPVSKPLRIDTLTLRDILFDFDKYNIKNPGIVDPYSSLFTDSSIAKIEVIGFTDDAGSQEYNLELSRQRAASVAQLLTQKFSIQASVIHSEGKGISTKYEDKMLNRRVEIYIYRRSE